MAAASKKPSYRRIVIKLSGEALMGKLSLGIDPETLDRIAQEIIDVAHLGVEVGLVIGGGNLFRGEALSQSGLKRITGDHMGMLATLMNALALRDAFERFDMPCRIMSAVPMSGVVDHYDRRKAMHHLKCRRIVIFAAGTGNPLVTTDSAASLRSIEVEADVLLKATKVDGVYSDDPKKNPEAVYYPVLTFDQVLAQNLGVMDLTAFCQCREHNMPIRVFNINTPGMLLRIVTGSEQGTLIKKNK